MAGVSVQDEPAGIFPQTRWTLILLAKEDPATRERALADLLAPRWNALYVLARRRGLARPEAEDAVQGFLERLVAGDLIERLDPTRGRLRAYLGTAFGHHLTNLRVHARAEKRGAGRRPVELDALEDFLAGDDAGAETLFDRAFALSLFEAALADLEREFESGARRGPFELIRQLFRMGEISGYEEIARNHGMSVPQLKAFVHRAKRRFSELLRARVAETVSAPADVDAELRAIITALGAG